MPSGISRVILVTMNASPKGRKVRENRLRRMAERQGLTFSRSRRRDPLAVDYGQVTLRRNGRDVFTTTDLDQLEGWLSDPEAREAKS